MTKVTLTLQKDAEHDEPYDEEVEIYNTDSNESIAKVSSTEIVVEKPLPLPTKLTDLEGCAINVVLDDCIQQLSIIKFLVNEDIHPSWTELFKYQPISKRFQTSSRKKQQMEQEVFEKIAYSNHQKLQKDVCFIITTLTELSTEVSEQGDYTVILNVLKDIRKEEEDNESVEALKSEHEAELEYYSKLLTKEKKEFNKSIREANSYVAALKLNFEDIWAYGNQEVQYTEDWEDARNFQNEQRLTTQEDVYNNIISNNHINIEYENRIHNEIVNFIEENCDDLQHAIIYWTQHYESEVDRRDSEIIRLKMLWEELAAEHIEIEKQYSERCAFIEEWRKINEDRRKAKELLKLQTAAAIKIQAWWRGTMVRKHLGPFSKKKKGKGKGKEKGKKK